MNQSLETIISKFKTLYSANVTAASITTPIPQSAAPSGNGVINPLIDSAGAAFDLALLAFYGVGTNGQTATARITAWSQTSDGTLWLPSPLLTLNLTFASQVGVAGTAIPANQSFVSTVVAATAFTTANEFISPAADGTMALVAVDPKGAALIEVDLAIGTCTSVNALWRGM